MGITPFGGRKTIAGPQQQYGHRNRGIDQNPDMQANSLNMSSELLDFKSIK